MSRGKGEKERERMRAREKGKREMVGGAPSRREHIKIYDGY